MHILIIVLGLLANKSDAARRFSARMPLLLYYGKLNFKYKQTGNGLQPHPPLLVYS